jgi:hypothetical protein
VERGVRSRKAPQDDLLPACRFPENTPAEKYELKLLGVEVSSPEPGDVFSPRVREKSIRKNLRWSASGPLLFQQPGTSTFKEINRMRIRTVSFISSVVLAMLVATVSAFSQGLPIYNTIPSPLPGNLFSLGYEATSTSEWGDQVLFAPGGRALTTVTVTMSSWGCQIGTWNGQNCVTAPGATFTHPITVNVYAVGAGNSVGALLATKTQTVTIPYRPSADLINCTGSNAGKWYEASTGTCFNGKAANVTIDLSSPTVTLPNNVIVSVAYNTSHYGYAPIGQSPACYSTAAGCPYDSLNVAGTDLSTLTVGSNPYPDDAYFNTQFGPFYCDGGTGPVGVFRLDAGCWTDFKPSIRVNAGNPPANANQCKNNGWQTFTRAGGSTFKNQGDCIQYVNTGN